MKPENASIFGRIVSGIIVLYLLITGCKLLETTWVNFFILLFGSCFFYVLGSEVIMSIVMDVD